MRNSLTSQFLSTDDLQSHESMIQLSNVLPGGPIPAELLVELIDTSDDGVPLEDSDFPWLTGNLPAFTRRAFEAMLPVFVESGRPIRLRTASGDEFVGLHVDTILDALDYERSAIARFSSGRIMEIETHVFRREAIGSAAIFRLPAIERAGWTYVQSEYVDAARATALPGAEFELLWTDEGSKPELA